MMEITNFGRLLTERFLISKPLAMQLLVHCCLEHILGQFTMTPWIVSLCQAKCPLMFNLSNERGIHTFFL